MLVKQILGFCTEKGKEIIVVGFEYQKKQGNAEGKTQGQEGRRNEGDLETTSENELKDEKYDDGENGDNQPISNEKKKS